MEAAAAARLSSLDSVDGHVRQFLEALAAPQRVGAVDGGQSLDRLDSLRRVFPRHRLEVGVHSFSQFERAYLMKPTLIHSFNHFETVRLSISWVKRTSSTCNLQLAPAPTLVRSMPSLCRTQSAAKSTSPRFLNRRSMSGVKPGNRVGRGQSVVRSSHRDSFVHSP